MNVVFEGVELNVQQNGTIQVDDKDLTPIADVDGYLKICINNQYYKVQNIIAMVYFDVDLSDKSRKVTHINKDKTDNSVDNLCIKQIVPPIGSAIV